MKLSLKRLPLIFIFFGRQPQGKKGGIKPPLLAVNRQQKLWDDLSIT